MSMKVKNRLNSTVNDRDRGSKSGNGKSSGAKVREEEKIKVPVVANARLVEALRSYDTSRFQTKSYLVEVATIVQEEQLTRAEVVASLIAARGIEKSTAESQYSRMKGLLTDPEILQQIKDGDIDLKTAREATKREQQNKNPEQVRINAEKVLAKAISTVVVKAKELGIDRLTLITTIKTTAKKAGLK